MQKSTKDSPTLSTSLGPNSFLYKKSSTGIVLVAYF
nr:MAG TPA: hypothetical protein [Caudoviricetes sp.]